jgi:dCMP deaminase
VVRGRSAKPLCSGSNPLGAFLFKAGIRRLFYLLAYAGWEHHWGVPVFLRKYARCTVFGHSFLLEISSRCRYNGGRRNKMAKVRKRSDYIGWDEYFMGVALLSAQRSKDPSTQVGACIVNQDKKIVGVGYNGFPKGCDDDTFSWAREGDFLDTKYPFVCHAELNAILNSISRDLSGCSIYVALFPCNECAKAIVQAGISEVVYLDDKYADTDSVKASKQIFGYSGVSLRKLVPSHTKLAIDLETMVQEQ